MSEYSILARFKNVVNSSAPRWQAPFGHELPSGLSLGVEDKTEWLGA